MTGVTPPSESKRPTGTTSGNKRNMKKIILCTLLLFGCLSGYGQRFRAYHAIGAQFNTNYNGFSTRFDGNLNNSPSGQYNLSTLRLDILASYDYGMLKWLGISTGAGFSLRGGGIESLRGDDNRRDLYYMNIPVKLQFKPWKVFWIETGVENKLLLGYSDINPPQNGFFDADELRIYNLTSTIGFRFNLFRGLSLNAGYHIGLLPVAEIESEEGLPYSKTTYKDFGASVGVRYMFNQPK